MSNRRSTFQPPNPIPAVTGRDGYATPRVLNLEFEPESPTDSFWARESKIYLVHENGSRERVTLIVKKAER